MPAWTTEPQEVEEMQYLRDFGWDDLVIGIESGDDDVLRHVNKATPLPIFWRAAAVWSRQAWRYRVIYLGGLAGKGTGSRPRTVLPCCSISCTRITCS